MNMKNFVLKKNIIFLIGLIILLIFFYKIGSIVLLFYVAFVLASAIDPLISWISRKIPRDAAIFLVFILGLIILLMIFVPLLSIMTLQAAQFIKHLPEYWDRLELLLKKWTIASKAINLLPSPNQLFATLSSYNKLIINRSITFTKDILSGLGLILTIAIIVYYMLQDKQNLKEGFLEFFPDNIKSKAENISVTISRKVGGYVTGQLIAMIITGILTILGLYIIGINYALLLGIIAGLLDIIPFIGPLIAIILAILVALAQSPTLVIWILIIYAVIQWIGNAFIRPSIFSKVLNLYPLIILFSLLAAGKLLGIIGVVIAPAIAATISVLIQEIYVKQIKSGEEL